MRWSEIISESISVSLFHRYGGKTMPFIDLPVSAQKAIKYYMIDGGHAIDENQFGYVIIPTDELIRVCWNAPDNEMRDDYPDWKSYHDAYWRNEDDTNYQNHLTEMWPVILYDNEGIMDGWHRLHWYFRNGVENVPAILLV